MVIISYSLVFTTIIMKYHESVPSVIDLHAKLSNFKNLKIKKIF